MTPLPHEWLPLFMYNQPSGIYHCSWAIIKKSPRYLCIPISPLHSHPIYPTVLFILHIHIRKLPLCRGTIFLNQVGSPSIFPIHWYYPETHRRFISNLTFSKLSVSYINPRPLCTPSLRFYFLLLQLLWKKSFPSIPVPQTHAPATIESEVPLIFSPPPT